MNRNQRGALAPNVTTPEMAREWVRWCKVNGVDGMKLVAYPPAIMEALLDEAKKLGLGSVAGLGAARLVTSHYSLMVTGISQMFVAGPPVVARVGEKVTKEELGGTEIHARNGAVDDEV